jgi:hypothetical protein
MSEDNSKGSIPPYLSFTTFRNFIEGMREGVIPSRIDKTMMVGQSGGTQSYLLSGLKFFDLIDDAGTPTAALEPLVKSAGTDWPKTWKPIFEKHYKSILDGLDLSRATVGQLHEKFAALGLTGETVRKCHSFFAAAADAAGIALSPHLKPNVRSGSGTRKPRKARAATPKVEEEDARGQEHAAPAPEGHRKAVLPLTNDSSRVFKVEAPATVTTSELKRIQAWLGFQLIVED